MAGSIVISTPVIANLLKIWRQGYHIGPSRITSQRIAQQYAKIGKCAIDTYLKAKCKIYQCFTNRTNGQRYWDGFQSYQQHQQHRFGASCGKANFKLSKK